MMRAALLSCLLSASLLSLQALAQERIRPVPSAETQACGSGVAWQPSLEAALASAQEHQRPVFWYVPTVRRSPMDRKSEIDHYMMAGPFSAPEVETLLNRRFIPVKEAARGEPQERYGLQRLAFIEPGFLLLAPDGRELLRVQKITTLSAEWFVWQLRHALAGAPALDRPSEEVVTARTAGDQMRLARALLAEGDLEAARDAAMENAASGRATPELALLRAAVFRRLHDETSARRWLDALGDEPSSWPDGTLAERLRLELAAGAPKDAVQAFEKAAGKMSSVSQEARFLHGAALYLVQREDDADRAWKSLLDEGPESRWTHKASAELQRLGPFVRAFERFVWLPDDAFSPEPDGTRVPRPKDRTGWLTVQSVRILLMQQRSNGSWTDSNYDFGGTDSLPNVYVAGTALAAAALLDWRDVDPQAIDAAVERACAYLLDEDHLAQEDVDEIVWAHAYRLVFFERYLRRGGPRKDAVRKKAREVARTLLDTQLPNGSWRHEYANPFATATVVCALTGVKDDARIPMGRNALEHAAQVLLQCRGEDGTFSYGLSRRGGAPPEGAAGRMPLCELALLRTGHSGQPKLAHALEVAFEHHGLLEAVRKYDDHADRYHNGGFFFWYDLYGRMEAIESLRDRALRDRLRARLLEIVLALPEIDGGFVDSHELGRTYGTAMGLIVLKSCLPTPP